MSLIETLKELHNSMDALDIKEVKELTTKTGKPYLLVTDISGKGHSLWDMSYQDKIPPFGVVNLTENGLKLVQKGSYSNIEPIDAPKAKSGATGAIGAMVEKKSAMIEQAQDKKERSIKLAQDRSAMMWAKNNAAEIIAHHPAYAGLTQTEVENELVRLSGMILNTEISEL